MRASKQRHERRRGTEGERRSVREKERKRERERERERGMPKRKRFF